MTWNNLATSVNMELLESQNERDARVEDLWRHLDPKETGEIDLKGLQRGLKKLNHRQFPALLLAKLKLNET